MEKDEGGVIEIVNKHLICLPIVHNLLTFFIWKVRIRKSA